MHIHGYRVENPTRPIINPSNLQTMKTSDQQTSGSWNISICNQKEGVGKSALTTLLASYLRYICKRKVLVVGCDCPNGRSTRNVPASWRSSIRMIITSC